MFLQINGEEREFAAEMTLAQVIEQLGLKADRVAVEVNREIVHRKQWPERWVKDGDRLEIVHFVGGGRCRDYSAQRLNSRQPLVPPKPKELVSA